MVYLLTTYGHKVLSQSQCSIHILVAQCKAVTSPLEEISFLFTLVLVQQELLQHGLHFIIIVQLESATDDDILQLFHLGLENLSVFAFI